MVEEKSKHYRSARTFSALYPFLLSLIGLLIIVGLPSYLIGFIIADVPRALSFGALLLLLPYTFLCLAVARQVGAAEVEIKNGKLIYIDSSSKNNQEMMIKDIKEVRLNDRFNPIYNTQETINFIDESGVNNMTINIEKFSGSNIKEILKEIQLQNPTIHFDQRTSLFIK